MSLKRVSIGDVELNVFDEGSGPIILFVHGFPLDHTMWRGQLAQLTEQYRCIAPDLRGFGRNEPASGVLRMEQFADDLAALLDALTISEPINYCGLSMGGYIGWQFAHRHGKRLAKFIQCDTRATADNDEGKANRKKLADSVREKGSTVAAEAMMPKLFADEIRQQQPQVVDDIREVIVRNSPETIAAASLGMGERPDATPWLAEIKVPTLILCGEHDMLSPPDVMRQIAAAIPGAKFVMIENVGHMAPLENAVAANRAIEEFLAG